MNRRAWLSGWGLLLAGLFAGGIHAEEGPDPLSTSSPRDLRLIDARLQAMPPATDAPALYAVGFAGDGGEDVFRNEVDYLETLMRERFGARVVVGLVNHPDSLGEDAPKPLATLPNLRHALAGIGAAMDRERDLLLLYLTTHGTEDHRLSLVMPGVFDGLVHPQALRDALDDAGIGNRIVIVSACFSGGFIAALRSADTLVMTAARHDRPSFGCGQASNVTWFGRALLVEAMSRDDGLLEAFDHARQWVRQREQRRGLPYSEPQLSLGSDLYERLQAWESARTPGPHVPYPHALD